MSKDDSGLEVLGGDGNQDNLGNPWDFTEVVTGTLVFFDSTSLRTESYEIFILWR